jgi:hypothetical protein
MEKICKGCDYLEKDKAGKILCNDDGNKVKKCKYLEHLRKKKK